MNAERTGRPLILGILLLPLLLWSAPASQPAVAQHSDAPQEHGRPRQPTDLQQYLRDLDSPSRDEYQKPAQVIEALGLKPGMAVVDLGAGSGYFTRRFAEVVGTEGTIYAVDVEREMLAYVERSLPQRPARAKVELILASPEDPKLPPASTDLIFLCNVYHHLEERTTYFTRLMPALRPGGRVAIIDFYHDERSGNVGFPRRHLVARETVIEEMARAGYRLAREHRFLPRQYFLEFEPAGRP
ncbi:class I SAM-dependent methyltransferase [Nitrospira sp. Kam-Ns4a]